MVNCMKYKDMELTKELAWSLVNYDPETGVFTRKVALSNRAKAGDVIGTRWVSNDGKAYTLISICGRQLRAHRLAHLMMTGEWPPIFVDHENGNGEDNRWENIKRCVTSQENSKNSRRPSNNKSGVRGVSWDKKNGKWFASIVIDRKMIFLGRFSDFNEAVKCRKSAEISYGFHANHGQDRPLYGGERKTK